MYFDSFSEFIAMDGHALYVWMAYGASVAFLVSYPLILSARRKRIVRELRWQDNNGAQELHSEQNVSQ